MACVCARLLPTAQPLIRVGRHGAVPPSQGFEQLHSIRSAARVQESGYGNLGVEIEARKSSVSFVNFLLENVARGVFAPLIH